MMLSSLASATRSLPSMGRRMCVADGSRIRAPNTSTSAATALSSRRGVPTRSALLTLIRCSWTSLFASSPVRQAPFRTGTRRQQFAAKPFLQRRPSRGVDHVKKDQLDPVLSCEHGRTLSSTGGVSREIRSRQNRPNLFHSPPPRARIGAKMTSEYALMDSEEG